MDGYVDRQQVRFIDKKLFFLKAQPTNLYSILATADNVRKTIKQGTNQFISPSVSLIIIIIILFFTAAWLHE